MRCSTRLLQVQPSLTLAIDARAKAMQAAGEDLVGFGAGEPDFNTPQPIVDAAKAALDAGMTKYTPVGGTLQLRSAIAAWYQTRYAVTCDADNVIVSCGGKHVLYNIAMALLEPGDKVLIPSPFWLTYPPQVHLAGATPIFIPCHESDHFLLTPQALEAAIAEHQPRMLILNSPSNPTGQAYDRDALLAICDVLRAHPNLILLWDSIYEQLVYDGFIHVEPTALAPDLRERIVVASGFSKAYAMTGWRLGYAIAPPTLVKGMLKLQGHCTSNATTFAQAGALAALTLPSHYTDEMLATFALRRSRMLALIQEIDHVTCLAPKGAFYAFVNVSAYCQANSDHQLITDDLSLATYLLEEGKVAVVPGSAFGAPGYIRLSYATAMGSIEKGLPRIAAALGKLTR